MTQNLEAKGFRAKFSVALKFNSFYFPNLLHFKYLYGIIGISNYIYTRVAQLLNRRGRA